jgi:hypothetical protein
VPESDYGLTFIHKEAPNGWVVIVGLRYPDQTHIVGSVFVPDAKHEWRPDQREECPMTVTVME